MEFLSTLAGNLPLLIIVLGGLLSLYKKFNSPGGSQQQGKPKQSSRPISPMPTFGGGPGEVRRPVRKAEPNPWEADHELKRRQEEIDREQEEWRREARAEAERRARRDEEEAASRGASGRSEAGQKSRAAAASQRSSPFQAAAGRAGVSSLAAQDDYHGIGGRETAAHTAGEWTPEGEELVKAVVWSEILGPPRSKRPYRR